MADWGKAENANLFSKIILNKCCCTVPATAFDRDLTGRFDKALTQTSTHRSINRECRTTGK
jgi:hypothetical protein